MSRRLFAPWKPKPGETDLFSQITAGGTPFGKLRNKKKDRSKAYSSNRTKPRRKK